MSEEKDLFSDEAPIDVEAETEPPPPPEPPEESFRKKLVRRKQKEHPLHVLLSTNPEEGKKIFWIVAEEEDYNIEAVARRFEVSTPSVWRWMGRFGMTEELDKRKAVAAGEKLRSKL